MRVLIIGAGIVGLSAAYALRKRKIDVTVVERGSIPCPLAASSDHHRIIRTMYGSDPVYAARMPAAYAAWWSMFRDLPQPASRYLHETGMLAVSRQSGDPADLSRRTLQDLGLPFETLDASAEIEARLPFLETPGIDYALLAEGGTLMANRIMTDLADWLRAHGADLREHSPVAEVDPVAGHAVLTTGERLEAEVVLICAGIHTAGLVPELTGTLVMRRTLIVYADPPPDLAGAWTGAPCWTDLGGAADHWGMPPVEALPLKLGNGSLGSEEPDDSRRAVSIEEITAMFESYVGLFKGAERFTLRWAQANYWTLAPDSKFLLKQYDRVIAISACSGHGFKFGALTGQDVADAVSGISSVEAVAKRMAGV